MKNPILIHYFLVNLRFFPLGFLYFLKMYHVRLFIMEKMGFGMAPRRCGIRSKPQPLLQKTFLFYIFETLVAYAGVCLRMHALAHVHRLLPTYWASGHFDHFIFKNRFFVHLKGYIFHFNTPQVILKSD